MKIFTFDLDGTLLENGQIADDILSILEKINQKNFITFATSRSIRGIKQLIPSSMMQDSLQILCNGAFATFKGNVIYAETIPYKDVTLLQIFLESHKIQYYMELGNAYYIPDYGKHPFFQQLSIEAPNERQTSISSDCPIYKIAVLDTDNKELIKELSTNFSQKVNYFQYSDKTIDIVSINASKWIALSNIAQTFFGDKYETISFGNDTNDIELLQNSSLGITMSESISFPEMILLNNTVILKKLLKQLM